MTDYSSDAIARRLKQVSQARRLGVSLRQAGQQIRDAAMEGNESAPGHATDTAGESQQKIIPRKR
jgi:hypothetical protein